MVENAVKLAYTRIYARLGSAPYHSLSSLNDAVRAALQQHNSALLKGRNYSRRQQFEDVERSALMPLPPLRYELKKMPLRHGGQKWPRGPQCR